MTDRVADEALDDATRELPTPSAADGEAGEVHVVGTAHVSHESVDEVEATITERRPDVVAVELDEGRYRQLKGETPDDLDAGDVLRGNTVFQFLAYWMLSYVQTRLGERFDIQPGAEMMAAVETAEDLGLGVALVDRDIQMTVQRFWKRLTLTEKLSLVASLTLAMGSPLAVGLGVGVGVGAVFGFALSMIAAGPLAFASADIVAALGTRSVALVGGLVGGAVAGVVLWALFEPTLHRLLSGLPVPNNTLSRVAIGVGVGSTAGVAIAATGGLAVGPLSLGLDRFVSIGGFVLQTGAGLFLGGLVGAGLGLLLGGVLTALVPEDERDLDDLDEFDIEELTDGDVVTAMMEEFRRFSPGGAEALIDERDAFIAHRLVALREAGYDVVAVVGAGHRAGIERYLERPETLPPMGSLVGQAEGSGLSKYLYKAVGYAFTLGFVVFFVLLAIGGASNALLVEIFVAWFVVNAIFAGGLARIAGARWPSAIVGGGVAWLTSVNPLLAPGWFAGYVELKYQSVSVADISRLNEILDDETAPLLDIVGRMREVPLFRLILVVAMTNVGSMIASLVVFPAVLTWLSADVGGVSAIGAMLVDGATRGAEIVWEVIR